MQGRLTASAGCRAVLKLSKVFAGQWGNSAAFIKNQGKLVGSALPRGALPLDASDFTISPGSPALKQTGLEPSKYFRARVSQAGQASGNFVASHFASAALTSAGRSWAIPVCSFHDGCRMAPLADVRALWRFLTEEPKVSTE
jgi:hypothetical protein